MQKVQGQKPALEEERNRKVNRFPFIFPLLCSIIIKILIIALLYTDH
jgi:hypothetical protein